MTEVKKQGRQSNFELMKIISMIFIVFWHYIHNTNLLDKTTGILHFSLICVWFIMIIHVNSFVIVMGYFQSEKRFKLSRFLSLNNAAWFYKVLFLFLAFFLGYSVSTVETVQLLSPVTLYQQYWFLATYLLVYCLSPFLNLVIAKISKDGYHKLLLMFFLLSSVLPSFTGQLFYNNISGHSIFTFIFLYFIGGYLKKYPIDKNYFFLPFSVNLRRILLLLFFLLSAVFNAFTFHYGEELLLSNSSLLRELGRILTGLKLGFDNPFIILQTVSYFLYFSSFKISNRKVNKIASCTFGVYLIHDNPIVRRYLYNDFFNFSFQMNFFHVYARIIISTILVFNLCIFIEWCRRGLFTFLSCRECSKKWRKKCEQYLTSLGIKVNW